MKQVTVLVLCCFVVIASVMASPIRDGRGYPDVGTRVKSNVPRVSFLSCGAAVGFTAGIAVGIVTPCSIICAVSAWYLVPVISYTCGSQGRKM